MREVKLVQITDTHIKTVDGGLISPEDADDALRRAVARINALAPEIGGIDAVIHTGDLVDTGAPEEYARFVEIMKDLRPPLYALPGNHDARGPLRAAGLAPSAAPAEGPIRCALDFGPVRALLLDCVSPGASHGELDAAQIAWAEAEIDAAAAEGRPAIVFAHHPPFKSGVDFMDDIRLLNGAALADMLATKPNHRLFACGHHHRAIITDMAGAPAIAAPAVAGVLSVQFGPNARPSSTDEQSALTLHVWREEAEERDARPYGRVFSYVMSF